MSEMIICSQCGCEIDGDVYEAEGEYFCEECYGAETFRCDSCGRRFLSENNYGDSYTDICRRCHDNYYHHCECCGTLLHDEDVYWHGDDPYCNSCYEERCEDVIHCYCYKPDPDFYQCYDESQVRYYGVELEIDDGGKDEDNAEEIQNTANTHDAVLYIKSDSSLDDGMELVSHPCSIQYHRKKFPWKKILGTAKSLYYRSHNTKTCGLHVHIGRAELGDTLDEQEEVISRIMFFFESHWNEMTKFSRRSEFALERWASRYGYKDKPKEILEDAKKQNKGRYTGVNIQNTYTIEIRIFRGTLKYNTFIATLEMVDAICENAVRINDDGIQKQSWNDFVLSINPDYTELIRYLKEKRLYVNEPVEDEEEI